MRFDTYYVSTKGEGRAAPERRRLGVGGNSDEELRPKGQSREDAGGRSINLNRNDRYTGSEED